MEEKSQVRAITRGAALWLAMVGTALGQSAPFKILHAFEGPGDGIGPSSGVIFDKQGNLYGVTGGGGNTSCAGGCGVVYELSPQKDGTWTEVILYSFTGSEDGFGPDGGLAMDESGNLYGVTELGGAYGSGTVFELTLGSGGWTETMLHSFCTPPNCTDGYAPRFAPVVDTAGNLYGTAGQYQGVAYELSPGPSGWTETVLYTFCSQPNCSDGDFPEGLVRDAAGNLYGPAEEGGSDQGGLIFTLRQQPGGGWAYRVLYNFTSSSVGAFPNAVDLHNHALFGNTTGCGQSNCGTVFELTVNGGQLQESLPHVFKSNVGGNTPGGNLAFDRAGNMYGTASLGGTGCGGGCGLVFELAPGSGGTWQYQVLHDFDSQDGELPQYGVISDGRGHLVGTTLGGGAPYYGGVVFEIQPPRPTAK